MVVGLVASRSLLSVVMHLFDPFFVGKLSEQFPDVNRCSVLCTALNLFGPMNMNTKRLCIMINLVRNDQEFLKLANDGL
jgi:hypothetical protein